MSGLTPTIFLVLGVVLINGVAGRLGVPAPILLVVAGVGASFIPGVPHGNLDPDLVLNVLLPPLLYAAAVEGSVIAYRALLRPIVQLAVGMVLVTAFVVALVTAWLIPDLPFAAALALGAIVAPPDAVAAVAVARRAGLPQSVTTVLEGESLFNDATSLVLLKVAIGGIAAGSMAWGRASVELVWATAGGILVGLLCGVAVSWLRRSTSASLPVTAISLVVPFVAHDLGDRVGASGVLAVVVAGLVLGFRQPFDLQPEVRLTLGATWGTIRYVLEGAVFALIGLELWTILTAPEEVGGWSVVGIAGAVLATVMLIRPLWIFVSSYLLPRPRRQPSTSDPAYAVEPAPTGWRPLAAVSWAGMRGVVSLAAALGLPLDTPFRNLLILCTLVVIIGTLGVQGVTLPAVIRALRLPAGPDLLTERLQARQLAGREIRRRVEEEIAQHGVPPKEAERLRSWISFRSWQNLGDEQHRARGKDRDRPSLNTVTLDSVAHWRRTLMSIERDVFVSLRNSGRISEEVMRDVEYGLDLEEALLERRIDDATGHLDQLRAERDQPGPTAEETGGWLAGFTGRPGEGPRTMGGGQSSDAADRRRPSGTVE